MGMDDALIYRLHRAHTYLDKPRATVKIMFFTFDHIDVPTVSRIMDYLTNR